MARLMGYSVGGIVFFIPLWYKYCIYYRNGIFYEQWAG